MKIEFKWERTCDECQDKNFKAYAWMVHIADKKIYLCGQCMLRLFNMLKNGY